MAVTDKRFARLSRDLPNGQTSRWRGSFAGSAGWRHGNPNAKTQPGVRWKKPSPTSRLATPTSKPAVSGPPPTPLPRSVINWVLDEISGSPDVAGPAATYAVGSMVVQAPSAEQASRWLDGFEDACPSRCWATSRFGRRIGPESERSISYLSRRDNSTMAAAIGRHTVRCLKSAAIQFMSSRFDTSLKTISRPMNCRGAQRSAFCSSCRW